MYPRYARSERIADGTMHAIGLLSALTGAILLIVWAAHHLSSGQVAALAIYGAALIATFAASTIYHFTPWEAARPVLRRIDHAAIYLKIAGTYTPFVVMVGSGFAYGLLATIWALALWGVSRKLFFWTRPGRYGPVLYLVMGWMGVALVWSALPILPQSAIWLMGLGGALYTAGVIFFSWEGLKFSLAIWHGFVVAASACFFAAVSLGAASFA